MGEGNNREKDRREEGGGDGRHEGEEGEICGGEGGEEKKDVELKVGGGRRGRG